MPARPQALARRDRHNRDDAHRCAGSARRQERRMADARHRSRVFLRPSGRRDNARLSYFSEPVSRSIKEPQLNHRLRALGACFWMAQACAAYAEDPAAPVSAQQIVRAGVTPSVAGPEATFTGRVRVDQLWPATSGITASGGYVTFEPGARSAWHTHPAGQRLVVISGCRAHTGVGQARSGTTSRRCRLVPAGREALARGVACSGHDPSCCDRDARWRERRMDGESQR